MPSSFRSVLLVAWALAACAPARTLDPDETEPVRIGVVLALSGDLGGPGSHRRDAVALAAREIQSAGGVLPGRGVELVIGDSESDPDIAVGVARDVVARRVAGLIGDSGSSNSLAIYQGVTQPAGVIQASGSSSSSRLTEVQRALDPNDRWFYRTVPSDSAQAPILADAMNERGCARPALAYVDNDYGVPFQQALRAALTGTVAASVAMTDGRADYSAEARMLAAANPDCIAVVAYPGSGGRLLRAWSLLSMRPTVRFFGTDALRQEAFVTEAGDPAILDGFLGTASITDPSSPSYNQFARAYEATFSRSPSTYDANFYDAAAVLMLAIAMAGSTDSTLVREALPRVSDSTGTVVYAGDLAGGLRLIRGGRPINYEGASGPITFDEFGDVQGVFEVWEFEASTRMFNRIDTILPPS